VRTMSLPKFFLFLFVYFIHTFCFATLFSRIDNGALARCGSFFRLICQPKQHIADAVALE
jgi:hypothetical protein